MNSLFDPVPFGPGITLGALNLNGIRVYPSPYRDAADH
jgi:hypothetical protein